MKSRINYLMLLLSIFALDRLTKVFLETKAENYGAAFGILPGYRYLFIFTAVIIIGIICYYLTKTKSNALKISLILMLAGTIGNLIDRIFYGYVIDILKIPLFNLPSFNLSDLSNITGAILLIVYLSKNRKV